MYRRRRKNTRRSDRCSADSRPRVAFGVAGICSSRLGWLPTRSGQACPPCRTARRPASCVSLPFVPQTIPPVYRIAKPRGLREAWADVDRAGCDTRNDILACDPARPTFAGHARFASVLARSRTLTRERQSSLRGGQDLVAGPPTTSSPYGRPMPGCLGQWDEQSRQGVC